MRALYEPLGVEVVVTGPAHDDPGVEVLRARLAGRTSVLFGQSGVGKSTLVNRLVPDADRAVGDVTGVGKGRHTSSSPWPSSCPGAARSSTPPACGPSASGPSRPSGCSRRSPTSRRRRRRARPAASHLAGTPGCALDREVERGGASAARLDSLRRLLVALSAQDD
jgi:ribosome biogenesis GTPase